MIHKKKLYNPQTTLFAQRTPKWFFQLLFRKFDIPKYIEVDFFTLSAFLLFEPFFTKHYNPFFMKLYKYHVINVYNWKYLT